MIIPRLIARVRMKGDGINLIPQGVTLIWLVPLETELYMEPMKDLMGRACWQGSLDKEPFPSLDTMTSSPILKLHPTFIMDCIRGLVFMTTKLEDCSAWEGGGFGDRTWSVMTNYASGRSREATDQTGREPEEISVAHLAQWKKSSAENFLVWAFIAALGTDDQVEMTPGTPGEVRRGATVQEGRLFNGTIKANDTEYLIFTDNASFNTKLLRPWQ
jgi:hypothetical protein